MAISLSVHDADYLAPALKHGANLITEDKQLAQGAASLSYLDDEALG